MSLSFYENINLAGGVSLIFSSPPQYNLLKCNGSYIDFPIDLPSETVKVWTVSLTRQKGEPHVVLHCNNVEVLNVVLSDNTCTRSKWNDNWSKNINEIMFPSSVDSASDFFRPGKYDSVRILILFQKMSFLQKSRGLQQKTKKTRKNGKFQQVHSPKLEIRFSV